MSRAWDVTVKGKDHAVTIESSESGKDVIRVDGRTAARPLSPEELERVFAIDGLRWNLRRDRNGGFELDQVDLEPSPATLAGAVTPGRAAAIVPASSGVDLSFLPRVIFWAVMVAIVGAVVYFATGPGYPKAAGERVLTVLEDMKEGRKMESHLATTIWGRNVRSMDSQELSDTNTAFMEFRREKAFNGPFTSFKIVSAEEVKGEPIPTALVVFEVDGKTYKWIVPERKAIRWAE